MHLFLGQVRVELQRRPQLVYLLGRDPRQRDPSVGDQLAQPQGVGLVGATMKIAWAWTVWLAGGKQLLAGAINANYAISAMTLATRPFYFFGPAEVGNPDISFSAIAVPVSALSTGSGCRSRLLPARSWPRYEVLSFR